MPHRRPLMSDCYKRKWLGSLIENVSITNGVFHRYRKLIFYSNKLKAIWNRYYNFHYSNSKHQIKVNNLPNPSKESLYNQTSILREVMLQDLKNDFNRLHRAVSLKEMSTTRF